MTALYGYARVSSTDQDLAIQRTALAAAGCKIIREEKATGTSRDGRSELQTLLDFIRKGDTLVVTRIDRLARSLRDLQNIVHELRQKGAHLKATEQPIDTSTAAGKAFLDMLGVFAEFETNLRKERQLEGIAAAKQKGVYKGRPKSIDPERIWQLQKQGKGATQIARELQIGRASVYRLVCQMPSSLQPGEFHITTKDSRALADAAQIQTCEERLTQLQRPKRLQKSK